LVKDLTQLKAEDDDKQARKKKERSRLNALQVFCSFAMLFLLSIIKRITLPTKALHAVLIECPNPSVTNMMKMKIITIPLLTHRSHREPLSLAERVAPIMALPLMDADWRTWIPSETLALLPSFAKEVKVRVLTSSNLAKTETDPPTKPLSLAEKSAQTKDCIECELPSAAASKPKTFPPRRVVHHR
jgi:hypothetical protein